MYESYTKSGGQDMNEMGNVNISEDVIVTISNIAANEIEGVAGVYSESQMRCLRYSGARNSTREYL